MIDARWSSNGEEILYARVQTPAPPAPPTEATEIIYDDGSCVTCSGPLFGSAPSFEERDDTIDVVQSGRLVRLSVDGRQQAVLAGGAPSAGTVSSDGTLALVRSGRIWIGLPHGLRAGPRGSEPEWSPGGHELAYTHAGHVMTLSIPAGHRRRVVAGSSPSWSPDARRLAYLSPGHHVRIVDLATDRSEPVGQLRGRSVNWGTTPPRTRSSCLTPPGARVIANSEQATLSLDGGDGSREAVLGCLNANGRERVLLTLPAQPASSYDRYEIADPTLADATGGLISEAQEIHYGGQSETVEIFNLHTGLPLPHLGGQTNGCQDYGPGCESTMDDLVVNPLGDSAVHTTLIGLQATGTEAIAVSDSSGRYLLAQQPTTASPQITALALNDTALTWDNNGVPQTAQLR